MDNLHDFENKVPPITIELCKAGRLLRDDYRYRDVHEFLEKQGYGDLGWRNDYNSLINKHKKTTFKDVEFTEQYSNWTGSQTLYVNHTLKLMYSCDMGD